MDTNEQTTFLPHFAFTFVSLLYLCALIKRTIDMREVELLLVNDTDKCAIYTVGGVKNSQTYE